MRHENWEKVERKEYRREDKPEVRLRLLNRTEARFYTPKPDTDGWAIVLEIDGEHAETIVTGLDGAGIDGYNEARRKATDWMRSNPYIGALL